MEEKPTSFNNLDYFMTPSWQGNETYRQGTLLVDEGTHEVSSSVRSHDGEVIAFLVRNDSSAPCLHEMQVRAIALVGPGSIQGWLIPLCLS